MGDVIYVNFRNETAEALFEQASLLDENPATLEESKQLYLRAVALKPTFAEAWVHLGCVNFRQGNKPQAKRCYVESLKHNPMIVEGHYNLAYVYQNEGAHLDAVKHFKLALKSDSQFADAHYNLAYSYERLSMNKLAKTHYRKFLKLEPDSEWSVHAKRSIERLG